MFLTVLPQIGNFNLNFSACESSSTINKIKVQTSKSRISKVKENINTDKSSKLAKTLYNFLLFYNSFYFLIFFNNLNGLGKENIYLHVK